jgi:hypothetical protein
MGGFLGIGNSSAKTDRGNQLAGVNADWNVYNRSLPLSENQTAQGTATTQAGVGGLQAAQQYFKQIMAGGPSAMHAAQPALSAVESQADAAKAQEAEMGTSRGGGTGAGNQQLEFNKIGKESDILAGQLPAAATGSMQAGTAEANVGQSQMKNALTALGLSEDVANEIINSSIQSRPISMKANAEVRQQWSNFLGGLGF